MNENRDESILNHILQYSSQITEAVSLFGNSYNIFSSNNTYRNACCLCLLQIGELAGALSEKFTAAHTEIPWKQIKGFRNTVAHAYGTIEPAVTWDIITNDIPELERYCRTCLNELPRGAAAGTEQL